MLSVPLAVVASPVGDVLPRFLVQVFIILILVRVLGRALHRIKQPMVIGEIIAGILLGPSGFGQIPGFSSSIFPPSSLVVLQLFANVGLIFFMFFLGLEVEPDLLATNWKASIPIAVSSIAVPFASGAVLSIWLYHIDSYPSVIEMVNATSQATGTPPTSTAVSRQPNFVTFLLFFGTALSFTAFPVLARILTSARLLISPAGAQSLACAAFDDLLGWCTLALVLSYANGDGIVPGLEIAAIALGYILFLVFIARPVILYVYRRLKDQLNRSFVAFLFLGLIVSSWFCEILGIHAFFGAFIFGIICPKEGVLVEHLAPKIELIIVEFFLPLYFANSGLRTSIGSLNNGEAWGATLVVIGVAILSKVTPVMLVSRLVSKQDNSWRTSLTMGILMNTRGLVALIVLNIGLDEGILGPKVFSLMVVMALVTTFMTSPLLYVLYEKPYHEAQKNLAEEIAAGNIPPAKLQREPSVSSVHIEARDENGNPIVVDLDTVQQIVDKVDIDNDEKYISTRRHKLTSPHVLANVLAVSSQVPGMPRALMNGSVHQLISPITRRRLGTGTGTSQHNSQHSSQTRERAIVSGGGTDDESHIATPSPRTRTVVAASVSSPPLQHDPDGVVFHLDRNPLVSTDDTPSDDETRVEMTIITTTSTSPHVVIPVSTHHRTVSPVLEQDHESSSTTSSSNRTDTTMLTTTSNTDTTTTTTTSSPHPTITNDSPTTADAV